MTRTKLARAIFGAAVAAALSVGAADALAAPAAAQAQTCDSQLCNRICRAIGAFGGTCINGGCSCYIR